MKRITTNTILISLVALLLAGCYDRQANEGDKKAAAAAAQEKLDEASKVVARAPIAVEYEKRLSESETIRGLMVPQSSNLFLGAAAGIRCLLYTNDAYKIAQIVCPDGQPPTEIRETGTPDAMTKQ